MEAMFNLLTSADVAAVPQLMALPGAPKFHIYKQLMIIKFYEVFISFLWKKFYVDFTTSVYCTQGWTSCIINSTDKLNWTSLFCNYVKAVGLYYIVRKIKYMSMPWNRNPWQIHRTEKESKLFGNIYNLMCCCYLENASSLENRTAPRPRKLKRRYQQVNF